MTLGDMKDDVMFTNHTGNGSSDCLIVPDPELSCQPRDIRPLLEVSNIKKSSLRTISTKCMHSTTDNSIRMLADSVDYKEHQCTQVVCNGSQMEEGGVVQRTLCSRSEHCPFGSPMENNDTPQSNSQACVHPTDQNVTANTNSYDCLDGIKDEDLLKAVQEVSESGSMLPLLKQELRLKIQTRRLSEGQKELVVDFTDEKRSEVCPEDVSYIHASFRFVNLFNSKQEMITNTQHSIQTLSID